jgi:Ca2+-binding EF-hand superfamily protein
MGRKSRIAAYVLGGVSLTVLVGGLALAAVPGLSDGRFGGGHGDRGFLSFLKDMDSDADGSVTRVEIAAFNAQRAAEIDADKDGQVTVAELEAYRDAQRQKRIAEHLAAMDSDGDGKVTVAELEAASTWQIARLDRDGDGMIEMRELGRHRGPGQGHGQGPDRDQDRGPDRGPDGAPVWSDN